MANAEGIPIESVPLLVPGMVKTRTAKATRYQQTPVATLDIAGGLRVCGIGPHHRMPEQTLENEGQVLAIVILGSDFRGLEVLPVMIQTTPRPLKASEPE